MFLKLADDFTSLNINVFDEDKAIQVFSSLPSQSDSLCYTLKYRNGSETLTLKESQWRSNLRLKGVI